MTTNKFKLTVMILWLPLALMAGKKKEIQQKPAYEVAFAQHIASQQLESLIDDYIQYPELCERVSNYLLYEYDYHTSPLTLLNSLAEKASSVDSTLARGMMAIVAERKGQILDVFSRMNYLQMGEYYKRSERDEHDFLQTMLRQVFLDRIEDFKYLDVKQLATAFDGTDLSNDFKHAYDERRTIGTSNLNKNLKEYADLEKQVGKDFKDRAMAEAGYLIDSLYDKINALVVKSFKTKNLSIENQLYDFSTKLTHIVQKNLEDCEHCIMEGRTVFSNELFDGEVSVLTNMNKIDVKQSDGFSFPQSEYKDYLHQVETQKEEEMSEMEEAILTTFTPLGWLGAIADLADALTPDQYKAKSKKKSVPNYAEKFNKKLYNSMSSSAKNYLENYFNSLMQNIDQSQKQFSSSIYENL